MSRLGPFGTHRTRQTAPSLAVQRICATRYYSGQAWNPWCSRAQLTRSVLTMLRPRNGNVITLTKHPSNVARTFCVSWERSSVSRRGISTALPQRLLLCCIKPVPANGRAAPGGDPAQCVLIIIVCVSQQVLWCCLLSVTSVVATVRRQVPSPDWPNRELGGRVRSF